MQMLDTRRVREIAEITEERIRDVHIRCFEGLDKPLFLISEEYPGLWLEHAYDAVFYASMKPEYLYLAENTIRFFIDRQTEEGQLPYLVYRTGEIGYSQIQECVSFYTLCLEVYRMNHDRTFLSEAYASGKKWIGWLRKYRMTTGRGLIEMFVGYDTGHDWSGRLEGMACPGNYMKNGIRQNAGVLPPNDGITPILAVDMNCNFYGDQTALAEMASELGLSEEAAGWKASAEAVKENLFVRCLDGEEAFFYDVDRNNNLRRYKSSTIFHLFLEKVLDPGKDQDLIGRIYREHIRNPEEFWTPYPFPSMALNDPSCSRHANRNCWGYFTQGGIILRGTRWMDSYGWGKDYEYVLEKWLQAWTRQFEKVSLGQEIDPVTGNATDCSPWYSSGMLAYLYAAHRLGICPM